MNAAIHLRNRLHANRAGKMAVSIIAYVLGLSFDLRGGAYHVAGMTFAIPKDQTTRKGRGSFALGTYEAAECSLVNKYLLPGSTVLELGACIGIVSCTVNKTLSSPANHVAVEANANLIPTLTKNRDLNNCKFSVIHGAVARHPVCFSAASQMECGRISESGVRAPSFTVEALEQQHGLRFDTVIADIEGAEGAFLRENVDLLNRLDLLIVEFHPALIGEEETSALRSLLVSSGMRFVAREIDVEVYARH